MRTRTGSLATHQPELPTSRASANQERNVLSILRALAPRRALSTSEMLLVAELQANRLLELAGLPQTPIPNEIVTELPRIVVRHDPDLPVSGSAHWLGGRWQLTINANEPWTRQRFSLAHELKHVIDHRHVETLYRDALHAEMAADYFAACLLMPKREVKRSWGEGMQSLTELANQFGVSAVAMARRLDHLGLRMLPQRFKLSQPSKPIRGTYTRRRSPRLIGATA